MLTMIGAKQILLVLHGRPGSGKTTFAANLVAASDQMGISWVRIDVERWENQRAATEAARHGLIHGENLKRGFDLMTLLKSVPSRRFRIRSCGQLQVIRSLLTHAT